MTTIEPHPLAVLARIMRGTIAACAILVLLIGTADAEQCPPGALGVSRTLVVDPNEHSRVGSMQYPETLPLNDHEVRADVRRWSTAALHQPRPRDPRIGMCEGDLLHGRANGARLPVDGAARLRRGPHRRQPHPKPPHSQNVCGSGGARDPRGVCVVARGHRGPAGGVALLSDTGAGAPEVRRARPRGPWRYDLERGFLGGRLDPDQQ